MKRLSVSGFCVVTMLSFAISCAGDGTGLDENGNPITASSDIELSLDDFALPVGATQQVMAVARDANGNVVTNRPVTWSSSSSTIATVDDTGLVAAVSAGAVTISASSDGATVSATVVVVSTATFAADVQPIFSANCASSGCHAGATPQLGQDLSQGNAYGSIVNVPSVEVPTMNRVTPGDAGLSYLVHKIRGTFLSVGGSGGRMPLGVGALADDEIDIIRAWVQAGAANN